MLLLSQILHSYEICSQKLKCKIMKPNNKLLEKYYSNSKKFVKYIYLYIPIQLKIEEDEAFTLLETHGLIFLPLLVPLNKEQYAPTRVFQATLLDIHSFLFLNIIIQMNMRKNPAKLVEEPLSYLPTNTNAVLGLSTQRYSNHLLYKIDKTIERLFYNKDESLVAPIPVDIMDMIEKVSH